MNVIPKNQLLYRVQCHYTKIAQRILKNSDIQYTSLAPVKILNSLIYWTLFYLNIYGSYKLLKTVRFFGPPCICVQKHKQNTDVKEVQLSKRNSTLETIDRAVSKKLTGPEWSKFFFTVFRACIFMNKTKKTYLQMRLLFYMIENCYCAFYVNHK